MQNTVSIKENREFSRLYRRGQFFSSDCLIIYFRKKKSGCNRLGITVSKKVGNAVTRNRIRRRIRESYRAYEDKLNSSCDIVIVARVKAAECRFDKINSALGYLFRKAELI